MTKLAFGGEQYEMGLPRSAQLHAQVEHPGVAVAVTGHRDDQLVTAAAKDAILAVARATIAGRIWRLGVDLVDHGFVEIELRGHLASAAVVKRGPDLEVDVDGPATVPAGEDGAELHEAVLVGHLIAAQERAARRRAPGVVLHVRVDA